MRISDWSSDVCSSDLFGRRLSMDLERRYRDYIDDGVDTMVEALRSEDYSTFYMVNNEYGTPRSATFIEAIAKFTGYIQEQQDANIAAAQTNFERAVMGGRGGAAGPAADAGGAPGVRPPGGASAGRCRPAFRQDRGGRPDGAGRGAQQQRDRPAVRGAAADAGEPGEHGVAGSARGGRAQRGRAGRFCGHTGHEPTHT